MDLLGFPLDSASLVSLLVLTGMELVLGIDNIVFITILASKLPKEQQDKARQLGLAAALLSRLVLLFSISWVMRLTEPLFEFVRPWNGKELILVAGGLFLIYKATHEIYENVERPTEHQPQSVAPAMGDLENARAGRAAKSAFAGVIFQIMLIDIVFSIDSVVTAVGMVDGDRIGIMVLAMLLSMVGMVLFVRPVGDFVQRHPSVRVLALSFLVLIGGTLLMEGTGLDIPKGYTYVAMGFALLMEVVNMRMRSRAARLRAAAESEQQ
jgi:predicted tellurium resistance membrane protein TerC